LFNDCKVVPLIATAPTAYEIFFTHTTIYRCRFFETNNTSITHIKAIRSQRTNNRNKVVSKDFIFKGMLKCANCGCSMSAETKLKLSGKSYTYYSCTNAKKICKKVYVTEKDLLKPVYDVLGRFGMISEQVYRLI
jgi:hypothetical protein